jgi:molybdate transport system substrate-binding protein
VRLAFLSGGAAQGLVARVAREAGVETAGRFGPVGAMRDSLLAGEACDIVILSHAQLCGLIASRHVDAGSAADLGLVRTSIAVRSGEAKPDVSTPNALRAALLAADAIHFPDPQKATAGIHFVKVLDALGIRAEVATRLRTHPGGIPAMQAVASSGGRPIGCTQTTEIVSTAGVDFVAPLPAPHGLATVYTAAVAAAARDPKGARDFVLRLTGRDAAGPRAELGFEGVAVRRAVRADEGAIRALVFDILQHEYAIRPDPEAIDRDLFDLDAHYFSRGGMFDVAIDPAGALVACCGTYATNPAACELRKMYVRRDQRGQGLGQRLLDRALAFARGGGFERVELETASVLTEAMAMYEKNGFVAQPHAPHVPRCDRAYALKLGG